MFMLSAGAQIREGLNQQVCGVGMNLPRGSALPSLSGTVNTPTTL